MPLVKNAITAKAQIQSLKVIEAPTSVSLNQLWDYWRSKKKEDLLPSRKDIDAISLSRLLPRLYLIEVLQRGLDFRYRLMGEAMVAMNGRSLVGMRMSDLIQQDPKQRPIFEIYQQVASERQPMFGHMIYDTISGIRRSTEFSLFPLASGGHIVDMILGGIEYQSEPSAF